MNATSDITKPLLSDDERRRFRHVNSSWGHAIAYGLQHKFAPLDALVGHHLFQGVDRDTAAFLKRRSRNKAARASRKINRRNH